jgi:hypothetical protein
MQDFAYSLDDEVMVGNVKASVVGAAAFSHKSDEYLLRLIDDEGLPSERWFTESAIRKARTH